jgi:VWFA-related protein
VFDAAIEEFRRADCVVHSVDISAPTGERSARRGRSGADGLSMMASGTGGEFFRDLNRLDEAAESLMRETAAFYVLTFQPANLKSDGAYHKLRVRLKNVPRGVSLYHRPGYYAPAPDAGAR